MNKMEVNKTSLRISSKCILNESLRAKRCPFIACSNNPRGLTSASGDSSVTSWESIRSTLLNYNVPDMNLIEQGLVTPRRRECLEYRQIRDKSYYMGIIHRKGYQISSEMKKLLKEISMMAVDESIYVSYKIKAQTQASEVKNLQDDLADYNMVVDFCNTEVKVDRVEEEYQRIKNENEKEISEMEKLFEFRKEKELFVIELEEEIGREKHFSNILDSISNFELCERYKSLKKTDGSLKLTLSKMEQELRLLNSEKIRLEELCVLPNNKEACMLLSKLCDRIKKRDVLFKEQSFQLKSHEMDYLEGRRGESKELLGCMLKNIRLIKTQVEQVKHALQFSNPEVNRVNADKRAKLAALKNRDTVIDSFLSSFPKKQAALLSEHSKLQLNIIRLLEEISGELKSDTSVDRSFSNTRNAITGELEDIPKQELIDRVSNGSSEEKFSEEKISKKENIEKNKEEIMFSADVDGSKSSAEVKITKLLDEANCLRKQRNAQALVVQDLQNYRDVLLEKINRSDLFMELSNLEEHWKNLEQENFAIKEQLADAKVQTDYHSVKFKVMETLHNLNEMLIK